MKRPLLLLILFFLSAQSFADDCPDGSELVRSISADGTYYSYNCNVIDLTKISTDTIAEAQPNAVAPGYMTNELTTKNWLSAFQLKSKDLSPMIIELAKKTKISVPEC